MTKKKVKSTSDLNVEKWVYNLQRAFVSGERVTSVLDVGCGCNPRGSVNCDLYLEDKIRHRDSDVHPEEYFINVKAIPNFVLCDAKNLPFKENCFETVRSRYLLEHMKEPFKVLREFVRVSKNKVIVEVPHRRGERLARGARKAVKQGIHVSFFDFAWFGKASQLLGCECTCEETVSMVLPHAFLPWFKLPQIFEATLTKPPGGKRVVYGLKARRT